MRETAFGSISISLSKREVLKMFRELEGLDSFFEEFFPDFLLRLPIDFLKQGSQPIFGDSANCREFIAKDVVLDLRA